MPVFKAVFLQKFLIIAETSVRRTMVTNHILMGKILKLIFKIFYNLCITRVFFLCWVDQAFFLCQALCLLLRQVHLRILLSAQSIKYAHKLFFFRKYSQKQKLFEKFLVTQNLGTCFLYPSRVVFPSIILIVLFISSTDPVKKQIYSSSFSFVVLTF